MILLIECRRYITRAAMTEQSFQKRILRPLLISLVLLLSLGCLRAQVSKCVFKPPDESVLGALSEAIRKDPKNPAVYLERGKAFCDLSRYDEALKDIDGALVLDPKFPDAYALRGKIYFSRGNLKRSVEDLSQAIDLRPGNLDVYLARALSYQYSDQMDLALQDSIFVLNLNGSSLDALYYSGFAAFYLNMKGPANNYFDTAHQLASKTIESHPEDPCSSTAYAIRGMIRSYRKNYKEAEIDLKTAKELAGPYDTDSRYELALLYTKIKYYQFAVDELNEIISIDQEDALAYLRRAEVHDLMYQKEKAAADRKKYAEISSK